MNSDDAIQIMISAVIFVIGGMILLSIYFPSSTDIVTGISSSLIKLIIYLGIGAFLVLFFKELIDEV